MFGVIRLISHWTNPHPAEFFNRLRLVLITAGFGFVLEKSPVAGAEKDDAVMLSTEPGALAVLTAQGVQPDVVPEASVGADGDASDSEPEEDQESSFIEFMDENATDDEHTGTQEEEGSNAQNAQVSTQQEQTEAEFERQLDDLEELFDENRNNLSAD